MESVQILFPIFPLVFLTYFQAYLNRSTVIKAIKDKEMDPRWMKYMFPWKEVPKKVQSSREHYKNLHQAPLFFYLYCILAFVTNHITQFTVVMACVYVATRAIHFSIREINPVVIRRAFFFSIAWLVSLILWIDLLSGLIISFG